MKKLICTSVFAVLAAVATVSAQDDPKEYLGLPGDNLNLYAVMNLFQESETLEAFERDLNDENSRINNLDLNGDNMVDYITVSDFVDGEVHTIVLRTALSRNEQQDVAVFTVEKFGNGSVQIQLIGDEALYGRNYIVEPIYAETPNPGYKGRTVSRDNVTVVTTTYYEVAAWPVVRFIYNPYYISWRSSWYWDYYPVYWNPWRPYYWHYYYGYHSHWYPHYYSHYRHWHQPRYHRYHDYYYKSVRAYSPNVSKRITEGHYKQTYSRPDTRRDGEALYSSTSGTRSNSARPAAASGTDRRSPAATGSSGRPAASSGTERRSPAATDSRSGGSQYSGQKGEVRRSTTDAVKSAPASSTRSSTSPESTRQSTSQRSQSTVQRSQPAAQRSQSTVQRSSQAPAQRSQSTVQRSSQAPAQRSQSTVQRSSQAPAQRSQSTVQRSQPSVSRSQGSVQKSSPSVSQRSSAPAARSKSSSSQGKSSSVSSRSSSSSSRSSAPSRSSSSSKSSSSKSSKSSDNNSRSPRR